MTLPGTGICEVNRMGKEEIPEAKALMWISVMFPLVESPADETDKMSSLIHLYCSAGARKIVELQEELDRIRGV